MSTSTTNPDGSITITSTATIAVVPTIALQETFEFQVLPSFPVQTGFGRLFHPTIGMFDYAVKPDEWVNIDADAIIPPVWAATRTMTGSANVLWNGNITDVVIEERWKPLGGLSMPVTQLRMLLLIWTTPVDPDLGYVNWYPTYVSPIGFKVLPVGLQVGGSGITFDDVANYLDGNGDPDGWITNPVTFQMKLVSRL
jgi:hypothetical protein